MRSCERFAFFGQLVVAEHRAERLCESSMLINEAAQSQSVYQGERLYPQAMFTAVKDETSTKSTQEKTSKEGQRQQTSLLVPRRTINASHLLSVVQGSIRLSWNKALPNLITLGPSYSSCSHIDQERFPTLPTRSHYGQDMLE